MFFISFGLCRAEEDERSVSITINNNVPQESKNTKVEEGTKKESKVEDKKINNDSNTSKADVPSKSVENKTKKEVKPLPSKVENTENKENKAPISKKKKNNENKNRDVSSQQNLDAPSAFEGKSNHPALPESLNDKKNLEEVANGVNDDLEKRSYVIRGIISMMLVIAGAVLLVIVIVSGYEKKNKKVQ